MVLMTHDDDDASLMTMLAQAVWAAEILATVLVSVIVVRRIA